MWRQKSRVQWLKEGDDNTRFFHNIANVQKAVNGIHNLRMGDDRVEDAEGIKRHVEDFFRNL